MVLEDNIKARRAKDAEEIREAGGFLESEQI